MLSLRNRLCQLPLSALQFLETGELCCSMQFKRTNKSSPTPRKLPPGPELKDFLNVHSNINKFGNANIQAWEEIPYLDSNKSLGLNRKVFIEVYGCQMNVNDTEIVWSILQSSGFTKAETIKDAEVILLMTCAIRENAEMKIWKRLEHLRSWKNKRKSHLKIGILGCMAERLKHKLVEQEKSLDVVAGPDSYKDLPRLLALTENNQTAVNVLLSHDETYADVIPVRLNSDAKTAFVSIMRGCDNMCTYCIVPFTRGRERSRPVSSIVSEIRELSKQGVKEVTLLGQNVNSYRDISDGLGNKEGTNLAPGFKTVYKIKKGGLRFAQLLDEVAGVDSQMRIRFTSPHPKDFPEEVLDVILSKPNMCLNLHMPAQSGSSSVLERMRRGYTRDSYLRLIDNVKSKLPGVTLSSDFICGFCGETDTEFKDTLSLMEQVRFNVAYLFAYSMREKTTAHRRYTDDVPEEVKKSRLRAMIEVYRRVAGEENEKFVGQEQVILIEGRSKKSEHDLAGKNDGNIRVIIPNKEIPVGEGSVTTSPIKAGDYVLVKVTESNSQILKGLPLQHTSLPT